MVVVDRLLHESGCGLGHLLEHGAGGHVQLRSADVEIRALHRVDRRLERDRGTFGAALVELHVRELTHQLPGKWPAHRVRRLCREFEFLDGESGVMAFERERGPRRVRHRGELSIHLISVGRVEAQTDDERDHLDVTAQRSVDGRIGQQILVRLAGGFEHQSGWPD